MISEEISAIRQALASGEYQTALRLWNIYANAIRQEIRHGTCTAGRMAQARELVEWAAQTVRRTRAEAQSRLDTLHAVSQYSQEPGRAPALLRRSF